MDPRTVVYAVCDKVFGRKALMLPECAIAFLSSPFAFRLQGGKIAHFEKH